MTTNWNPKFTYYPDPLLRCVAKPVEDITEEILKLFGILKDTCIEHEGVGLAAHQIGIVMPVIVFGIPKPDVNKSDEYPKKYDLIGVVNPKVIWQSEETEIEEEGCLSLPGIYAPVERPVKIVAEGWFEDTKKLEQREFSGITARIFAHETDHTRGILFIDHVDDISREMIKPQLAELAEVGGEKIFALKTVYDR